MSDEIAKSEEVKNEYKVDLEVFEGPLDLLLYLIRRDEIDIYDISIERITKQYIEYLDMMKMLDLNIAGEFLVMSATLMLIKSRMLLPVETRKNEGEEDEEEIDPRLDLIRQLVEYKKFKDAAGRLMNREALQSESFLAGGEVSIAPSEEDTAQKLGDIGLFDLLSAFQEVLEKAPVSPLGQIRPIQWSVPDKMDSIILTVKRGKALSFSRLFSPESERGEVIVTFLALLELLRLRQVTIKQLAPFTEIVVSAISDDAIGNDAPIIGGAEHVES